jgi:hypothetical protein
MEKFPTPSHTNYTKILRNVTGGILMTLATLQGVDAYAKGPVGTTVRQTREHIHRTLHANDLSAGAMDKKNQGPSKEQLDAEKHPEFLEKNSMLFIKIGPHFTRYGIVNRILPHSKYKDRFQNLKISDFNNIDSPKEVKDAWWLYLPSDKEKERIPDTTLMQYAKRASAKVDHKVPWQILAAIVRTETEGTNLNFRQEFHQPIDDVRFLGNDQESIRVYRTMLAKYGNLLGCSYGPAHVMYRTAFELGFRGTPMELAKPEVSLEYAAKRLLKYCGDSLHNPVAVARAYNGDPHYAKKFISNLQKFQSFPV